MTLSPTHLVLIAGAILALATPVAGASTESREFNMTVDVPPGGHFFYYVQPYLLPCQVSMYLEAVGPTAAAAYEDTTVWFFDEYHFGIFNEDTVGGNLNDGEWDLEDCNPAWTEEGGFPPLERDPFCLLQLEGDAVETFATPWVIPPEVSGVYLWVQRPAGAPAAGADDYLHFYGYCAEEAYTSTTVAEPYRVLIFIVATVAFLCFWRCMDADLMENVFLKPRDRNVSSAEADANAIAASIVPVDMESVPINFHELERPHVFPSAVRGGCLRLDATLSDLRQIGKKTYKPLLILSTIYAQTFAFQHRFGYFLYPWQYVGLGCLLFVAFYALYRAVLSLRRQTRALRLLAVGIVVDLEKPSFLAHFGPAIVVSCVLVVLAADWTGFEWSGMSGYLTVLLVELGALFLFLDEGYDAESRMLPLNKLMENPGFQKFLSRDGRGHVLYVSEKRFLEYRWDRGTKMIAAMAEAGGPPSGWCWGIINREDLRTFVESDVKVKVPSGLFSMFSRGGGPLEVFDPQEYNQGAARGVSADPLPAPDFEKKPLMAAAPEVAADTGSKSSKRSKGSRKSVGSKKSKGSKKSTGSKKSEGSKKKAEDEVLVDAVPEADAVPEVEAGAGAEAGAEAEA